MTSKFSLIAVAALAVVSFAIAKPAHAIVASGLIGSSVTGQMYILPYFAGENFFDPANGYVPSGYENLSGTTVTISGAENEFGYQDGSNTDTAGFSGTQLFLHDASTYNDSAAITYIFTDPSFTGASIISDNFLNGVTYSFSGDTLTINQAEFAGNNNVSGVHAAVPNYYGAVFTLNGSPTPEASTTVSFALLLALGLGAGMLTLRKKKTDISA
jgi:hypothetical protein